MTEQRALLYVCATQLLDASYFVLHDGAGGFRALECFSCPVHVRIPGRVFFYYWKSSMLYPHRVSYPGFQVRNRSRLSSYTLRLYFAQGCTKYTVDASALCVPIDVVSLTAPAPAARSSCRQPPNCRLLHATVDRSWAGRVSCAGRRSSRGAASIHAVGDVAGSAHARRGPEGARRHKTPCSR